MTGTWRRRVLSGPESNKWCKRNGLTRAQGRDDTGPRVNRSLLAERTADWRDRIWWPAGGARGEPTQLVQRRARRPKAGREGERGRRGGWGRRGGAAVAGSKPTKRAQGSAAREPAAAVEQRAWRVTELGLARTGSLLVERCAPSDLHPTNRPKPNQTLRARRRPPSDWAPLPSRSLATRQSPPLAAHAHGVLARLAPAPHPAPGPRRHARLRYPPPPRGRGP